MSESNYQIKEPIFMNITWFNSMFVWDHVCYFFLVLVIVWTAEADVFHKLKQIGGRSDKRMCRTIMKNNYFLCAEKHKSSKSTKTVMIVNFLELCRVEQFPSPSLHFISTHLPQSLCWRDCTATSLSLYKLTSSIANRNTSF